MYRHFVRVNEKHEVVAAFCDAFEQPKTDDVLIEESAERHFRLDLQTASGVFRYEIRKGKLYERTADEITALEGPILLEAKGKAVRAQRDQLMRDTDYTVLPDSSHDSAEVRVYRQALRDVPQQAGFPEHVQWPVKP